MSDDIRLVFMFNKTSMILNIGLYPELWRPEANFLPYLLNPLIRSCQNKHIAHYSSEMSISPLTI